MTKPEIQIENWKLLFFSGHHFDLDTTYVLTGDALNHPTNYPRTGYNWVRTSQILSIDFVNNIVETKNTRYILGAHAMPEPKEIDVEAEKRFAQLIDALVV